MHNGSSVVGRAAVGSCEDGCGDLPPDIELPSSPAHETAARPPPSLATPDDVADAIPPGRVKLLAYTLIFFIWVGGWGAVDIITAMLSKDSQLAQFGIYAFLTVLGLVGLKALAYRYRGYALLD